MTHVFPVRGQPFDSEGGAWQILSGQIIYFRHVAGQKIYFQPLAGKIIYFLFSILWNLEARIFIFYFQGGVGQIIYFHLCPGQNIYLQKLPGPPQNQMVVPLQQSLIF